MKNTFSMLPLIVAVFILFSFGNQCYGQQYAKIKLKGNSYLKGNIVEGMDSSAVIININGSISRIPLSNIQSIDFKKNKGIYSKPEGELTNLISTFPQFEKGYFHSFGMGFITGNDYADFSATMINGYRFNQYLNAGVGLSYNRYEFMSTLPLFLEYRGFPLKQKFAPYFFGQIGYGFRVESIDNSSFQNFDSKGGLYWGAGVGYQIDFYETALSFSVGYSSQASKTEYSNPDFWGSNTIEYSEKRTMGRTDIKVNLIF